MKFEEFKEKFELAPYELDKFASLAMEITDNDELSQAASDYLESKEQFLHLLEINDFEMG